MGANLLNAAQNAESKMPKLRVHSGAKKRFRKTANGIKKRAAFRNHILTKKSTKQKRRLRVAGTMVKKCDTKSIERMLHGS